MSIKITIEDIFNLPTAEIINPDGLKTIKAVSINSKEIGKDALFIAIKGKKFDGHSFTKDAEKNGACAIMVNRKKLGKIEETKLPVITVDDTTKALGDLASIWRKKLNAKVIAITGSAGKTTTKEAVSVVLKEKYSVVKTEKNNNNHIGVPLTILSTQANKDILVLELGTNHFGEINYSAQIAAPDIALITNIGSSHLEYLGDKKGVLKEKKAIFDFAQKNGGSVLINNDDKLLSALSKKYTNSFTYGSKEGSSFSAVIKGLNQDGYAEIEVKCPWENVTFISPLPGMNNAENMIATVVIALATGLNAKEIQSGLKKIKAVDRRLNIKKFKTVTLIDDTYNANPESMKNAITVLASIKAEKKVAILGDMFELGEKGEELHKEIGKQLIKSKINEVLLTGSLMKFAFSTIENKIQSKHFSTRKQLEKHLSGKDYNGTAVLVKGSRGMKMEEFVKVIEERVKS